MLEVWKDVIGYENYYMVSNLGRIKSLHRGKERILALTLTKLGYVRVELNVKGAAKKYCIHRLVAEAFIPVCRGKDYVNHKNNNRSDNCVDNLEWCTASENIRYAANQGRLKCVKGTNNGMAELSEETVIEIRRLAATKQYKQKQIGEMFGLDEKHISLIVLRKRWKHI